MAGLKFMPSLVLVLFIFTFVENCDSFSFKIPPNPLQLKRLRFKVKSENEVRTSLSYVAAFGPSSNVEESAVGPGPVYESPAPATHYYIPGPGSDPYPAVPASPGTGQVHYLPPSVSEPVPGPAFYGSVPNYQRVEVPAFHGTPQSPFSPAVSAPEFYGPVPSSPEGSSSPPTPVPAPNRRSRGIKAAYWPSFDGFPAAAINTTYFTHIYYAFLLPEPETFQLNLTQFDQTKIPEFINTLRTKNPPVSTLLSIGGGGNDPTVFSKMVSTDETRAVFINSTIEVARRYGFDGVDLDWEFPANDQDMSNLAILYSQWRKALNFEARISQKPRLLLTSAVYYSSILTDGETRMYPIEAINNYVDWVSPMCFDYHGKWENFTGVHAALYGNISTSHGLGSWIRDGVPPRKLVMGLPLYGHTWKLQDPNVNGIGAPAVGVGPGGGILLYSQIMEFNSDNRAVARFDLGTASYYSYAGDSWVGYDDIISVQLKIIYAKSRGLGGYFFWALGQDQNWTLSKQASNTWGR